MDKTGEVVIKRTRRRIVFTLMSVLLALVFVLMLLEALAFFINPLLSKKSVAYQSFDTANMFWTNKDLGMRHSQFSLPTNIKSYIANQPPGFDRGSYEEVNNLHAWPKNYSYQTPKGLFVPVINTESRAMVTTRDEKIIYDVKYEIDQFGRRVTEHPHQKNERNRFLVLMGDSYVYGEGVESDETLGAWIAKRTKRTKVYNSSFHGYGPNSLIARAMETPSFFHGISENKGLGVYVYTAQQFPRVIVPMSLAVSWGAHLPILELDKGEPNFKGSFRQTFPRRFRFYNWLSSRELIQLLKADWPLIYTKSHYEKVAHHIHALKLKFLEMTGAEDFIVVILRDRENSNRTHHQLMDQLDQHEIKYLDYSRFDMDNFSGTPLFFKHEGHPLPLMYRILGEVLMDDLSLE